MNPVKLSDERVREILGDAVARVEGGEEELYLSKERSVDLTLPEIAALAQAVLDLRTANAMLEHNCDEMAKSEEALRRSLDKAAELVR